MLTDRALQWASGTTVDGSPVLTQNSSLEWSKLNGIPTGLDDGDDNTQLSQSDVVSFVTDSQVNLGAGSQVNGSDILTSDSTINVDWSNITNVPSGLDDGDDNGLDVVCADGEILTSNGTEWECAPFNTVIDSDSDGVLTWNDCDDEDSSVGGITEDADCDGVPSAEDCDDNDASNQRVM